jgi:hypothetical protein
MRIANEINDGKNVKAMTFKLHEALHNLDGTKCGVHIALTVMQDSLSEVIFG